jgi:predicted nucleic acid-binding protein
VLIALYDVKHEYHKISTEWANEIYFAIAISPIVENGLLRIFSHPNYPNGASTSSDILIFLEELRDINSVEFCADNFSFSKTKLNKNKADIPSKHITDIYLLNLAKQLKYFFVTFDRKIPKKFIIEFENIYVSMLNE